MDDKPALLTAIDDALTNVAAADAAIGVDHPSQLHVMRLDLERVRYQLTELRQRAVRYPD
jgi:hypothetical protein